MNKDLTNDAAHWKANHKDAVTKKRNLSIKYGNLIRKYIKLKKYFIITGILLSLSILLNFYFLIA
jgi:hypothetical protein